MTQEEIQKQAEAIQQTMLSEVFVPAFVKAAADRGYAINNDEELEDMLQIAEQADQIQQATVATGSRYKQAAAKLQGFNQKREAGVSQSAIKAAAAKPEVLEAIRQAMALQAAAQ